MDSYIISVMCALYVSSITLDLLFPPVNIALNISDDLNSSVSIQTADIQLISIPISTAAFYVTISNVREEFIIVVAIVVDLSSWDPAQANNSLKFLMLLLC